MPLNARDVLLTLSYLKAGDWKEMYNSIKNKEKLRDEDIIKAKKETKAGFLSVVDDDYPTCFKHLYNPPLLLYYYGNLSLLKSDCRLTVIGTRNPTLYQNNTVYDFVKESEGAFDNKLIIVSGMAKGIDQAGMKAAMDVGAPVISVIGSGIDNPYPKDNAGIYEYCKSGKGLIMSEYPNTAKAAPNNFVFRNRLLAALSDITFVGGGKRFSGSMSTVRQSIELNNEILALPCNTTGDDLTNDLIKDGATSVLTSKDIIDALKHRLEHNR